MICERFHTYLNSIFPNYHLKQNIVTCHTHLYGGKGVPFSLDSGSSLNFMPKGKPLVVFFSKVLSFHKIKTRVEINKFRNRLHSVIVFHADVITFINQNI